MIIETNITTFEGAVEIVGCMLYKSNNSFLLLKRHPNKPEGSSWGAPGGKVESGETLQEAIIRETQEETGILLQEDDFGFVKTFYVIRERDNKHLIYHLFCAEYHEENIFLNQEEHTEYGWFDKNTAPSLHLIHDMEPCIQAFIENRKNYN